MRDILAGGVLVQPGSILPVLHTSAYSRRRRAKLLPGRDVVRAAKAIPDCIVQPGQLASPFLKFGFPSLALH